MLILARKYGEAVVVGGVDGFSRLLKVTVLEIKHGKVKLGFEVDENVPVYRMEVWDRIQAEGRADLPADDAQGVNRVGSGERNA
jgi:carbon storage regulator CsrA